MNVDESLERYSLRPGADELPEIRRLLVDHTEKERQAQGTGDTEVMKLCCVQLFNAGHLEDVDAIWHAKTASMDADASIDVQLLCGAGLERTKAHLRSRDAPEATAALERIEHGERSGDFDGFSVSEQSAQYAYYYDLDD